MENILFQTLLASSGQFGQISSLVVSLSFLLFDQQEVKGAYSFDKVKTLIRKI